VIHKTYVLYHHDYIHQPLVLSRMGEQRLEVMAEYQDLVCKKCGKVNEQAALVRGIYATLDFKSNRQFIRSWDNFHLVDERAKEVLSTLVPDQIDYYRIPSSAFYVASAKVWSEPDESDPGFNFARARCKQCGRPGEIVWGKCPPTIAGFGQFVAMKLEGTEGARENWLFSEEIASKLKKTSPPLKGLYLSPKEVDDGCRAE
jgi:hypothetical protein